MTNSELLNKLIDESGLRRTFIAEKMDISKASLSRKIKGERPFNQYEIAKICSLLNITDANVMQLIFLTGK